MNSVNIAKNIIRRLLKEPYTLILILIFPLIGGLLAIFLYGHTTVIKVNIANIAIGSNLINTIESTGKYSVNIIEEKALEKTIKTKEASIGIIIPKEYGARNTRHERAKIISNKRDNNSLEIGAITEEFLNSVYSGNKPSKLKVTISDKQGISSKMNVAIGFMLMFMFLFAGTCMGTLLEDKNVKTLMRIFSSPIKEYEIVLGNLLADVLLGALQIVLFLFFSIFILNINFGVPPLSLFVILFTFFIAAIGFNIGLSGLVNNYQTLFIINFVIAGFTCMLGGAFIPLNLLSNTMRKVANFIPQKWSIEAYERLLNGGSFRDIQPQLFILLLFGAVFFTFGLKTLTPSEE